MKTLIFSIALLLTTSVSQNKPAELYTDKLAERMVKIALKEKDVSLLGKVEVNERLDKIEPIDIYRFTRNDNTEFYAVFTQAKGRYEMFDYLLSVNSNFSIEKVRVLKYRSEHGGEIASKKWLRQFENYSSGELRYKKEISALSGATLSAESIVADVPMALEILKKNCN